MKSRSRPLCGARFHRLGLHFAVSCACVLGAVAGHGEACAQPANVAAPRTDTVAVPGITSAVSDLRRGRLLLDVDNPQSVDMLRAVAQGALETLSAVSSAFAGASRPPGAGREAAVAQAREVAAEAHYWWGKAAARFSSRDEAIMALARAVSLSDASRPGAAFDAGSGRDAGQMLSNILREGLPLVAPDDVLDVISSTVHGNLWQPRRLSFDLAAVEMSPAANALSPAAPRPGTSPATVPPAAGPAAGSQDLLVTSGKLFPPVPSSSPTAGAGLRRIPHLYRAVDPDALPPALKMDRITVGYARESDGPDRGKWRQLVRVFYASNYLTRDNRDDRPRAEALCAQFLKVALLARAGLKLGNAYPPDGVTTLWLSEVSAWWPSDDEDISALLPAVMPRANIAARPGEELLPEIVSTPVLKPWRAGAWIDSAPDEIILFRMTQPRDESEWLREIMHEYGHIVLPQFSGFQPPLEPFGNGAVGETLGMLWAASAPRELAAPQFGTADATDRAATDWAATDGAARDDGLPDAAAVARFTREVNAHVAANAAPALRLWNEQGPTSSLRRNGTGGGLQYLQGLVVYIDRVYGARILASALTPLAAQPSDPVQTATGANRNVVAGGILTADSLLGTLANTLNDPFERGQMTYPIWLGGAFEAPSANRAPAALARRGPLTLRAGERTTGWLYVPSAATTLQVEWRGAPVAGAGLPLRVEGGWKAEPRSPSLAGSTGAAAIEVGGRSGWQRFTLVATGDLTIGGVWFGRNSAP